MCHSRCFPLCPKIDKRGRRWRGRLCRRVVHRFAHGATAALPLRVADCRSAVHSEHILHYANWICKGASATRKSSESVTAVGEGAKRRTKRSESFPLWGHNLSTQPAAQPRPFCPRGHKIQISPLAPASLLSVSETSSSTISSTGWILVRWVRDMPART